MCQLPFQQDTSGAPTLKHISSTGFSRIKLKCTPQFLADQASFYGIPLTIQQTTTVISTQGEVSYTLLSEYIYFYLKVNHSWLPIASY